MFFVTIVDSSIAPRARGGFKVGQRFPYLASVTAYANKYITEACREDFLRFVQPETLFETLENLIRPTP